MGIVGNRFEPPTALPNRTLCATKDISELIDRILSDNPVNPEHELFQVCVSKFKECGFSEIMKPLGDSLETAQYKSDIFEIFTTILTLTLRTAEPLGSAQVRVLVYLLYIFVTCQNTSSEDIFLSTPDTPEDSRPATPTSGDIKYRIPVTVSDVQKLTKIVNSFPASSLVCQVIKYLYSHNLLIPKSHSPNFYIDHTRMVSLRNNAQDAVAKVL